MNKTMKFTLLGLMLLAVLLLSGCNAPYNEPLGADQGVGWVQWIVTQIANLVFIVSQAAGGYYVVGLVAITLLIRIAGWPIYSKTNALSTNMHLAQPDLEKVREKYMNKKDAQSQRMMQQETMGIYKEFGINPLGCFLPLLQMPIFIAMYQVVRRIPLTPEFDGLNFNFLWFSFKDTPIEPFYSPQNITFLFMALLVGASMFGYQMYVLKKPEPLQNKKFRTSQQAQSEKTMKYMTYFMTFMLVTIAFTSLGIAFYWIIGNLLQFFQTWINRKKLIKRLEERRGQV